MKDTMGIILTGGSNNRLKELSENRSSSAIPVGGKYRAIDFALSNMVNSGISKVGVITQYNFRSLMDHLGSGKEWDLDRRYNGLFIFPPYLSSTNTGWYRGSADAMYNNLTFLMRSNDEFVLVAQGNGVYRMTFDEMLEYHMEKTADITIAYREMNDYPADELVHLGIISMDETGRIKDMEEKPLNPTVRNGSMGIYLMKRKLLISLLEESSAHGYYDFVKDILIKKINSLNISGFRFTGYWRNISTVRMYYRCNMELLDPAVRYELFDPNARIFTKVKDETPAKYNEEAEVGNSIIADGCIIEGSVKNSVLFRGVTVKKGARIIDSIVMQGTVVEENSTLRYAIIDKNVVITQSKYLKGEQNLPVIVGKGIIV